MAKRKSITGIKKKKLANKAAPVKLPTPTTSSEAPKESDRSVASRSEEAPKTQTLLSIQNSRRKAQQGRVNKSAHRTYLQASSKSTLKHVHQATIETKWRVLDPSAQVNVESLFQSIGLPVLAKHINQAGKVEAQDAISLVTRSLCKRLPKMPFPQTTKAGHFDYDNLVKDNRELQQRLVTVADLIASSKAELEKQRIELRGERRELQQIETTLAKQDTKTAFLPSLDEISKPADTADAIGLVSVVAG